MFTNPRSLTPKEDAYISRYLQRDFRKNLFGGGVLILIGLFIFLLPILTGAEQPGLVVFVFLIAAFVLAAGSLPPLWAWKRQKMARQAATVSGPLRRRIITSNGNRETTCYIGKTLVVIPALIEGLLKEGTEITVEGVPYTMGKIESLLTRAKEGCIALVVNGDSVATGYQGKRILQEKEFKPALVVALTVSGIYLAIVLGQLKYKEFAGSLRSHPLIHILVWMLILVSTIMTIRAVLHNRRI